MFRKIMLAGLMATTLVAGVTPAMAQRGDGRGEGRGEARGQWQGHGGGERRGEARGPMRQGPQGDRMQQRPQPQNWQGQRPDNAARPTGGRPNWQTEQRGDIPLGQPRPTVRPGQGDDRGDRDWRNRPGDSRWAGRPDDDRRNDRRDDWRDDRRNNRRDGRWDNRGDNRPGQDWNRPAWNNGGWNNGGRRYDDRNRWTEQRRWDNRWRDDRRYDWRGYRARYGDQYRIGRYYAPRGWNYGYRQVSIGFFLSSMLYANNYWLNDPWSYRLPPAYGTLRWVRYFDDALLVDVRDGYVVDVIRDFFW